MYEVKLINDNEEVVINAAYVNKEAPHIISGTIKKGINTIDSFTFSIISNNPGFYFIKPKKTLIEVFNVKENRYEFKGRVLLPTPSMSSDGLLSIKSVCESELGYLHDSNQRYGEYHNISVRDFLKVMLDRHNACVEEYKRFELGKVEVTDSNNSLYRYLSYEQTTFEAIKDKLIDRLGGELRIRYENGVRYLDYLKNIGEVKETEIRLAKNLVSIEEEKDPTSVISKLVVLGSKLEDSEERLNITSVNNGLDYIVDETSIEEFGINEDTIIFDDVNIAENLLRKGKEYLKENNRIKKKYKVEALDLSIINLDIDTFEVGNIYRVINTLMNIDEDLRVIEKTLDISNPQNSSLSIGDKFENIKDYQLGNLNTAKEVKSVKETVKTTVNTLNSVSIELNNTVEILNKTNESISNINGVVEENLNSINSIVKIIEDLNKKVEVNSKNISDISVALQANVDATNIIANTVVTINNKLEKINRRISMGV